MTTATAARRREEFLARFPEKDPTRHCQAASGVNGQQCEAELVDTICCNGRVCPEGCDPLVRSGRAEQVSGDEVLFWHADPKDPGGLRGSPCPTWCPDCGYGWCEPDPDEAR